VEPSDSDNPSGSGDCACEEAPAQPQRRTALAVIVAGAGSLVLGSAALAAGFLSNALGRARQRPWIKLGSVEDTDVLNVDTFQRHVVQIEHVHAWKTQRVPLDIYIKDRYPDEPIALLSTCSHLGCSVKWKGESGSFDCPCHGGRYDEEGRVIAGPPPRPLTRLEVKIENDDCFVRLPDAGGDTTESGAGTASTPPGSDRGAIGSRSA
jgi:Rieske Fe-S protein